MESELKAGFLLNKEKIFHFFQSFVIKRKNAIKTHAT